MPFEITYYDEPCGAITKFFGVVTDQDLLESARQRIQSTELYEKITYFIDDYTGVEDVKITVDGVQDVSTFAIEISVINKNIKFLVILPNEHLYALGVYWKVLSYDTGWKINIAGNQEDADLWIRENIG